MREQPLKKTSDSRAGLVTSSSALSLVSGPWGRGKLRHEHRQHTAPGAAGVLLNFKTQKMPGKKCACVHGGEKLFPPEHPASLVF